MALAVAGLRDDVAAVIAHVPLLCDIRRASRITAPAWLSAALMDPVCPPSTVFGAYHELIGPKSIQLWEYNGHEGGAFDDDERAVRALAGLLRD